MYGRSRGGGNRGLESGIEQRSTVEKVLLMRENISHKFDILTHALESTSKLTEKWKGLINAGEGTQL